MVCFEDIVFYISNYKESGECTGKLGFRNHWIELCGHVFQDYDVKFTTIVTQDPMQSNMESFWNMIVERNAAVIVMLTEVSKVWCG